MTSNSPAAMIAELRRQGIRDERVLAAMAAVPRHLFVAALDRDRAYENVALRIDAGQTISQPYVVALMAQALAPQPHERVLEIGAGSGYGAAALAHLAREVITIERHERLAETARQRLAWLGYHNVNVYVGDGSQGWPAGAPYDAIAVTAAAPAAPAPLLAQLDPWHGRLAIPVGDEERQHLMLIRLRAGVQEARDLGPVRFVPLIGADGWPAERAAAWERERE
jgi:protein-L-isoaspartate(D-aspartate) O-methyltransferase